jgi:hypothetical protein
MWIRELATGWERVYKPSEHASASVTRGTRDAVPTRTTALVRIGLFTLFPTVLLGVT